VVIGFRGFFRRGCGDWVWGVGAKICGFMVVVGCGLLLLYFVGVIESGFAYGNGFDVGLCCIAVVLVGLILGLSTVMVLGGSFGFDGGCGLWDAGNI
jgi:hypothetical protein